MAGSAAHAQETLAWVCSMPGTAEQRRVELVYPTLDAVPCQAFDYGTTPPNRIANYSSSRGRCESHVESLIRNLQAAGYSCGRAPQLQVAEPSPPAIQPVEPEETPEPDAVVPEGEGAEPTPTGAADGARRAVDETDLAGAEPVPAPLPRQIAAHPPARPAVAPPAEAAADPEPTGPGPAQGSVAEADPATFLKNVTERSEPVSPQQPEAVVRQPTAEAAVSPPEVAEPSRAGQNTKGRQKSASVRPRAEPVAPEAPATSPAAEPRPELAQSRRRDGAMEPRKAAEPAVPKRDVAGGPAVEPPVPDLAGRPELDVVRLAQPARPGAARRPGTGPMPAETAAVECPVPAAGLAGACATGEAAEAPAVETCRTEHGAASAEFALCVIEDRLPPGDAAAASCLVQAGTDEDRSRCVAEDLLDEVAGGLLVCALDNDSRATRLFCMADVGIPREYQELSRCLLDSGASTADMLDCTARGFLDADQRRLVRCGSRPDGAIGLVQCMAQADAAPGRGTVEELPATKPERS